MWAKADAQERSRSPGVGLDGEPVHRSRGTPAHPGATYAVLRTGRHIDVLPLVGDSTSHAEFLVVRHRRCCGRSLSVALENGQVRNHSAHLLQELLVMTLPREHGCPAVLWRTVE